MSELAIQAQGLRKHYKNVTAVNGLDLNVRRGAVYGFLGRNGAGKTTTIKTLLGLVHASGGSAQVLGYDVATEKLDVLRRTGFVSENKMLFEGLTGAQLVRFNRGYFPQWSDRLMERYVQLFEIPMDRRFGELSLGNRTKVCLLMALCQGAELLILDEPTSGLDPVMVDLLMRVLIEDHVSEGRTVFVSTHNLTEVERIAEWVGIIERGRLLLEARVEDIRHEFRMVTAVGDAQFEAKPPELVSQVQSEKFSSYLVSRSAEGFAERLRAKGNTILEISPVNLNEVFLGLVRKELPCISGKLGTIPAAVC